MNTKIMLKPLVRASFSPHGLSVNVRSSDVRGREIATAAVVLDISKLRPDGKGCNSLVGTAVKWGSAL